MKRFLFCILLIFLTARPGPGRAEPASGALRIVSAVPSQTEMLFALGFGALVVGVTDFCNYPASATALPSIGAIELNLEKIVALNPTHVVDLQSMHRRYQGALERMHIRYLDYPLRSVADVPRMAASLATDLGFPQAGERFRETWEREMPPGPPVDGNATGSRVFIEIWNLPLQGAGPSSFLGELLELSGGRNILASATTEFPLVNPETVVREDPEIILLAYPASETAEVEGRSGWRDIAAVRRGRVMRVEQDLFVRPGPRLIDAYRQMRQLLLSVPRDSRLPH